ncbi:Short-chain dehydrogenase of various substrate specificity [Snodgrassella alvi SCGC AB-598-O02]|nr:Short-chain dehydrogenase of various substrate specificity [Snodgrassella alvi SCGC AB-598-O02]
MQNTFLSNVLFPIFKPDFSRLAQRLHHKTIIITGASYGIGEALSYILADIDCRLILLARTTEKLQTIQHQLSTKKAQIEIFPIDLRNNEQIDHFLNHIEHNQIDILINNAGHSICRPIMQSLHRLHDFERTMQLNYFAQVKLCLALIPKLQQTLGQIINVSAINVLLAPTVNWAAYQASKTAFDQWLRCASAELENQNIKISTAYLPLVRTRMIEPTKLYDHVPALQPQQAATIICRLLLTRKHHYKPWWTIPAQLASVLFNPIWQKINYFYVKRKQC